MGDAAFGAFWLFTLTGILALAMGHKGIAVPALFVGMGSALLGVACAALDVRNDARHRRRPR